MPLQNNFKDFDSIKVPLKGSNLIEASAGTGKTYSIAILVLRLILENKIPLRKILMVTFTKAAVAELETRIRSFVKDAYKASTGLTIKDETIVVIVENSINKIGKEQVTLLLKNAVTTMDETSVMTIHSFCQQTLNEFAFETNQLFSAEMVGDTSDILQEELNKFWRKNITTLSTELLSLLMDKGLSQNEIYCIVKEHLNGKQFYKYNSDISEPLNDKQQITIINSIAEINKKKKELEPDFVHLINNNKDALLHRTLSNRYAKKTTIPDLLNDPIRFMEYLLTLKTFPNYIVELYEECGAIAVINDLKQLDKEIEVQLQKSLDHLYSLAINEISAGFHKFQLHNNQLSYADLIYNLNEALTKRENPRLVKALQEKYKAVFIDEFQDTDKLQYEIFNTAFSTNTILFYIGDPKQSIYAWRSADIFTYLKAKEAVENRYEMNTNFRSTESYIDAMNAFFLPEENFDTFYFGEQQNAIQYNPVKSPNPNVKGRLLFGEKEVTPISINDESSNIKNIALTIAKHVAELISNEKYFIQKGELSKKLTPADIGILVRSNKETTEIKKALAKYNIPSISIDKSKILESPEAKELLYVLMAMEEPNKNNINRALFTCFTQYKLEEILNLNHEIVTELFRDYKSTWEKEGVYKALIKFITEFEIRKILLNNSTPNGERILTNLYHLIELLYKNQRHKNWHSIDLIEWLKHGIEQKNAEGDELEVRMETDEEAVTITTIHSSKGLQYNIVLAPNLNFVEGTHKTGSFRDPESGKYLNGKKEQFTEEHLALFKEQSEQENRRLLYVALTRAVYKCFIFKNHSTKSTLVQFTNHLKNANPNLIDWINTPEIDENFRYQFKKEKEEPRIIRPINFSIEQQQWKRMSYSGLTHKPERSYKPPFESSKKDYDNFIFNELTKGKITGNMIHFIFKKLAFNNEKLWEKVIQNAIKRFAPTREKNYAEWLPQLLQHVMKANIETSSGNFQLSEIDFENRVHELEFDFPVGMFNPIQLTEFAFLEQYILTLSHQEMEGIMNGKIDMLFELNGQYFILDWKSNYLGWEMEHYSKPALEVAMNENNFHLQYFIYTVATKKYLELRLPNFNYEKDFGGVLYCFVRGMRKEKNTGVFWIKPSLEKINKLENLLNVKSNVE